MGNRSFRSLIVTALALSAFVVGCGGDDGGGGDGPGGGGDSDFDAAHDWSTGANDVVVRLDRVGEVMPEQFDFLHLPAVLIAGDGALYTPAPVVAPYPGPLVPLMDVRTVTPQGIDATLALADANGLLADPPEYTIPEGFSEVDEWVVTINADGGSFVHEAVAIGFDARAESDPDRRRLQQFTDALAQLDVVIGAAHFGLPGAFVPAQYRIRAVAVDPADFGRNGQEATVRPWPGALLGVALADAVDCARVAYEDASEILDPVDQLTLFEDGGEAYQLFVAPVLPGDGQC